MTSDSITVTVPMFLFLQILKLLVGKVVIGHAVQNDFKVLGYGHPGTLTRDTSRCPLINLKAGFTHNQCVSLKRLTKAIFDRDIQVPRQPSMFNP